MNDWIATPASCGLTSCFLSYVFGSAVRRPQKHPESHPDPAIQWFSQRQPTWTTNHQKTHDCLKHQPLLITQHHHHSTNKFSTSWTIQPILQRISRPSHDPPMTRHPWPKHCSRSHAPLPSSPSPAPGGSAVRCRGAWCDRPRWPLPAAPLRRSIGFRGISAAGPTNLAWQVGLQAIGNTKRWMISNYSRIFTNYE